MEKSEPVKPVNVQISKVLVPAITLSSSPTKGKLDSIDLINMAATELKLKEQRQRLNERINKVFGSTSTKSKSVKHITKLKPLTKGELKLGKNRYGEPSIVNELKPVVLEPKPSTFRFSEKHPMEFDFPPPRPDEEKLMGKDIMKYKASEDVVQKTIMAKIYRHGKLISVMSRHPGFAKAKREENLRLNNEARIK